jgi:hypothetical protein
LIEAARQGDACAIGVLREGTDELARTCATRSPAALPPAHGAALLALAGLRAPS